MELLLPAVKAQLTEYSGFTDADIREYLWESYLEVDPTVKELKS